MDVVFTFKFKCMWYLGRIRICFGIKVESGSVLGKRSYPDLFWGKGRIRICFGEKVEFGSVLGKGRIRTCFGKKSNPDPYFEKDRIRIRIFKMVGSESGLNNQFFWRSDPDPVFFLHVVRILLRNGLTPPSGSAPLVHRAPCFVRRAWAIHA